MQLYSGVDIGISCLLIRTKGETLSNSDDVSWLPAFNLTPIGISVGKGFLGMLETHVGTDAFVKVGIGARF